jgi:putative peptidoglycan lipid II flippase
MSRVPRLREALRLASHLIGGAMLSKILGFAREIIMAAVLGANIVADSFRGASWAVLLPLSPLTGEVVPCILIPLQQCWQREGRAVACASSLGAAMFLVSLVVGATIWLLASPWADLMMGGFGPHAHAYTVQFIRIMVLAAPPYVLLSFMSSIEIASGRSRITLLRGLVLNVAVIMGICLFVLTGNPMMIGWAFVVALTTVATVGGIILWREGKIALREIRLVLMMYTFGMLLSRARPLIPALVSEQGCYVLERALASGIAVGALASLDYARSLSESMFFLISSPVGLVVLAHMRWEESLGKEAIEQLHRAIIGIGLPISVFIAVFATDLVHIVYQRGAFDERAADMTSVVLHGAAPGLWAGTLGWVLIRILNAQTRNGAAAIAISFSYAVNALVCMVTVPYFGALGLGLGEAARGIVLLSCVGVMLSQVRALLRLLLLSFPAIIALGMVATLVQSAVASPELRIACGAAIFGTATTIWLAVWLPDTFRTLLAFKGVRALSIRGDP